MAEPEKIILKDEPKKEVLGFRIDLIAGEVKISGNIPRSPVMALGMLEDAKIKIIGMLGELEMREQKKKEIIRPNFWQGVSKMLSKK